MSMKIVIILVNSAMSSGSSMFAKVHVQDLGLFSDTTDLEIKSVVMVACGQ